MLDRLHELADPQTLADQLPNILPLSLVSSAKATWREIPNFRQIASNPAALRAAGGIPEQNIPAITQAAQDGDLQRAQGLMRQGYQVGGADRDALVRQRMQALSNTQPSAEPSAVTTPPIAAIRPSNADANGLPRAINSVIDRSADQPTPPSSSATRLREHIGPYAVVTQSQNLMDRIRSGISDLQDALGLDLKSCLNKAGDNFPLFIHERPAEEMPTTRGAYVIGKTDPLWFEMRDLPEANTTTMQEIGHHIDHRLLGRSRYTFSSDAGDNPAMNNPLDAVKNTQAGQALQAARSRVKDPNSEAAKSLSYYAEPHEMFARTLQQAVPQILADRYSAIDPERAKKYNDMRNQIDFGDYNKVTKLTPDEIREITPLLMKVLEPLQNTTNQPK